MGFGAGVEVEPCGMVLEPLWLDFVLQVPNIAKKIEAFKKDVEAKKKPPE